jgi:hypothetical protein
VIAVIGIAKGLPNMAEFVGKDAETASGNRFSNFGDIWRYLAILAILAILKTRLFLPKQIV